MKRIKWLIIALAILLVAAFIWYWRWGKDKEVVVLQTEKPAIGKIASYITATGTIQPVDTVAVGTQVSGIIKNVYVDFNSTVKKGQLLAQLDKSLLQTQVEQISANLQQAKDNYTYQQSNLRRQEQLYNAGAVSRADYELALNQYNTAANQVKSYEAQLKSALRNLSYADIYSPIDGTVLSRNVSEGQTVAASFSTPTLFSIARNLARMQVKAAVDEADIGNVKKGQRVTFNVDAFPKQDFNGTIKDMRLQPTVSSNVVTYVTIIDAPNAEMKLKPGMTASITVYTREIDSALLISARALQFEPDSVLETTFKIVGNTNGRNSNKTVIGKSVNSAPKETRFASDPTLAGKDSANGTTAHVWLKKDSSIEYRPIMIGMKDNVHVQIISGLSENDIVVNGYEKVKKEAAGTTQDKSPFMPVRPRGTRRTGQPGPPR